MADEVTRVENELDEARGELLQTLRQIHRKVDAQVLRPENILRVNPLMSIGLASAVGFTTGITRDRLRTFGIFGVGLLAGLAIMRAMRVGHS